MINIAALISGRGSNLQAVIDACQEGRIDGQVTLVISNKAEAYGLIRAQKAGIKTVHLTKEDDMITALAAANIDLVILAVEVHRTKLDVAIIVAAQVEADSRKWGAIS